MYAREAELRFDDAARRLLAVAREESDRLHHAYVGTEHVALALLRDPDSAALLARLGVDGARVRETLDGILRAGTSTRSPEVHRPYTSRTLESFAHAAESARLLGRADVSVPDILVGLLREGMNVGVQALQLHGLTAERAALAAQRPA